MTTLIQAVEKGDNIVLTGGAGVGKTYQSNIVIEHLKRKGWKFAVCALTGLASQHLHFGMTIHRFLGVGGKTKAHQIHDLIDGEAFTELINSICHVRTIFIDEISMMRPDFWELMDAVLKYARSIHNAAIGKVMDINEQMPFGGYQLILVGDFCQLPPVVKDDEDVPCKWVFQHKLFKEAKFRIFNLTVVQRTSNEAFAVTLNKVRVGYCDDMVRAMIQSRSNAKIEGEATVLMSKVKMVSSFNDYRLTGHNGDSFMCSGIVKIREELKNAGKEDYIKELYRTVIKESGLDKEIKLKIGSRVMLLANNVEMGFSNGSQGRVLDVKEFDDLNSVWVDSKGNEHFLDYKFFGPCLIVLLDNGQEILVPRKAYYVYGHEFDDKGKRKVDATFLQHPVTLGYAISIHKSQGMSLERMIMDCDEIFADGQFYVALSRARSLEGLSVLNFDDYYIKADSDAVDFYLSIGGKEQGFIYE